ncbi:SMP-30/gluconolactonase/LRE family protein [Spelaeicoccus albus]|uniref:Gluconolactonase n=1 Tax=Spelaeicoccus albus TaxID=1280376 RepID=A0A7Z0ABH3_9MICO|nr:SMP-30/gluconolactonase/LRE family protein [Spelaeicoccus albus]NYI67143.1 gluconolactonase [Spelaeicoccus albus]
MTGAGLIPEGAQLERVATGARWAEGPVWLPERRAVRFSDIHNNRILEYLVDTGLLEEYNRNAEYTNGRTLDRDGVVIECSHGLRAVCRDTGTDVEVLVDSWHGHSLNSPNDVVVKSDGTIWFTDPTYGISRPEEGHVGSPEYGDAFVFRVDPSTGDLSAVVTDVVMPNGLAFSPDESILYVADSSAATPDRAAKPLEGAGHSIHAYDIVGGRRAKNGREFAEISPGIPDGLRVDTNGNVWTSSADSVQIFTPDAAQIGSIPVPETVANLCFGESGRLFITATTSLYSIQTNARPA